VFGIETGTQGSDTDMNRVFSRRGLFHDDQRGRGHEPSSMLEHGLGPEHRGKCVPLHLPVRALVCLLAARACSKSRFAAP
jgi:hypothetical protein